MITNFVMKKKKLILTVLVMALLSLVAFGIILYIYSLLDEARYLSGMSLALAGMMAVYILIPISVIVVIVAAICVVKNPHTAKLLGIYVLIVILIVIGVSYYRSNTRIDNVFDQLYYTRHSGFGQMSGTRFHGASSDLGHSTVRHKSWDAEIHEEISFFFGYPSDGTMFIDYVYPFPGTDETMYLSYHYQTNTNELEKREITILSAHYRDDGLRAPYGDAEHPEIINDFLARHDLTRVEIEELHCWFLFEYFLPLWYETTRTETRFSQENWGEFMFAG